MNEQLAHQERIERLAYRLWQERGSPFGSPDEDWYRAESEFWREVSPALSRGAEFAMAPVEERDSIKDALLISTPSDAEAYTMSVNL